jgi:hypothetical protein
MTRRLRDRAALLCAALALRKRIVEHEFESAI